MMKEAHLFGWANAGERFAYGLGIQSYWRDDAGRGTVMALSSPYALCR